MAKEVKPPETAAIGLGISFKGIPDKDGRREIVFQTHLPLDVPLQTVNGLLDKMAAAVERQGAKAELVRLEQQIVDETANIDRFRHELTKLDEESQEKWEASNRREPWDAKKIPPQERSARVNLLQNMDRTITVIKAWREQVAKLKETVGDDVPASKTDC